MESGESMESLHGSSLCFFTRSTGVLCKKFSTLSPNVGAVFKTKTHVTFYIFFLSCNQSMFVTDTLQEKNAFVTDVLSFLLNVEKSAVRRSNFKTMIGFISDKNAFFQSWKLNFKPDSYTSID